MKKGLLSVIVPVYNMEEYISKSIDTVLNQTYKDIEVILIDDGSTDNSGDICEMIREKDNRVKVYHQKNQGSMVARDKGISEASGEYITFFDGDDWIEAEMYETLLNKIGDADMVTSGALREEPNHSISRLIDGFEEGYYSEDRIGSVLCKAIFDFDTMTPQPLRPDIWDKIYRTELMKEITPYQEYSPRNGQDLLLLYRYLLKIKTMVITHDCYYHYHYREKSTVHSKSERLLIDLNHVYLGIKMEIDKDGDKYNILTQTQKWIAQWVCGAFSTKMGFEKQALPIMFVPYIEDLLNKKIVLYGAGNCGISFYNYIQRGRAFEAYRQHNKRTQDHMPEIVGWLDENDGKRIDFIVTKPQSVINMEYDMVVICVLDKAVANDIKKKLLQYGVEEDKIYWEPYMSVL